MVSAIALRAILGASLALGAIDVLWLDVKLAPRVVGVEAESAAPPMPAPAPPAAVAEPSRRLPEQPPPPPTIEAEPIYFASSSAALDDRARAVLDRLAAGAAGRGLALEGHADPRGHESDNTTLSRQRAGAARDYLIDRGI